LDAMHTLDKNPSWLRPGTIVILQIDPKEHEEVLFQHMRDYDQRRYGNTLLWFFEALIRES